MPSGRAGLSGWRLCPGAGGLVGLMTGKAGIGSAEFQAAAGSWLGHRSHPAVLGSPFAAGWRACTLPCERGGWRPDGS